LSIYSTILEGKKAPDATACVELVFSGTADDPATTVSIELDNRVLLTQTLCTQVTRFVHMVSDLPQDHELKIKLDGQPTGAMLHIQSICIEGLNMRLTMENIGKCELDGQVAIPSEYMGQVGYQSLQFSTPIYPWLLANERKDSYYYPHLKNQWQNHLI
jgi:hypothetical protein